MPESNGRSVPEKEDDMETSLKKLIKEITVKAVHGPLDKDIPSVEYDSRKVAPGAMFVAVRGTQTDGHKHIAGATAQGAKCVVLEEMPAVTVPSVTYIEVPDSSAALAEIASAFYGHPSRSLKLTGVTGTNGKTTTATLLYDLFTSFGYACGLLSTVVNKIAGRELPATHTTPDPLELNRLLVQMTDAGCEFCFMEVSSHAVVQNRVRGLHFAGGIFTNLTHDHLDYHKTFAEYLKAKKGFFDILPASAFALVNIDDKNGPVMQQNCPAHRRTYSLRNKADYHCRIIEPHMDGMLLEINGPQLWVQFIGRFNAYNLLAVYGAAVELGASKDEVLTAMSTLKPVAGRFECIRSADGRLSIVDYAHTPDALQNVLATINELKGGGQVITVVGCGGDRDNAKRPVMARIAAEMSGRVILTSDNPRTEDPAQILRQMEDGLDAVLRPKALTIADRREAIRTAVALAAPGDIILIAGKGHEPYQEINGIRHHFDDRQQVAEAFDR